MPILLSGSIAYDYIMDFPDSFKNHILPDQIHILSVAFAVEKMQKNYGGTAANIAYSIKLLGGDPLIFAPIGSDGKEYLEYFKNFGIDTDYISPSKDLLTSSAHIITDKDDNQITAFYAGAGIEADKLDVNNIKKDIKIALICAAKQTAMIAHAKQCFDLKIPICFDPGQQITALSPQEVAAILGQSKFLIVNDYEMKLVQEKTGWDGEELLNHVEVLITTLGSKGSVIRTKNEIFEIAACPPQSVDDPTGAGDAYRSGFFTGYVRGFDYKTCGQMGSVAATYAVEKYGTQNHKFTIEEFEKRYKNTYSQTLSLKT